MPPTTPSSSPAQDAPQVPDDRSPDVTDGARSIAPLTWAVICIVLADLVLVMSASVVGQPVVVGGFFVSLLSVGLVLLSASLRR